MTPRDKVNSLNTNSAKVEWLLNEVVLLKTALEVEQKWSRTLEVQLDARTRERDRAREFILFLTRDRSVVPGVDAALADEPREP